MGFHPRLAFFFGCVVPRVTGLRRVGGEVASEGVHPHHPEMLVAGEAAFPARSGPAVEISVRDSGAVANGALRGNGCPGLGPGGFIAARGTLAAIGQVGLDEGSGSTGALWCAAAGADAITAHAVDRTVLRD